VHVRAGKEDSVALKSYAYQGRLLEKLPALLPGGGTAAKSGIELFAGIEVMPESGLETEQL